MAHVDRKQARAFEVALQIRSLVARERAPHVGGEILAPACVIGCVHASPSASSPRIFSKPSRILPFTVPIGRLRMREISEWLKPPK